MSRIRSPYVMPFLGACLEPPESCVVLTELMLHGDLKSWLAQPRSLRERLTMALDVARGMQVRPPPLTSYGAGVGWVGGAQR
jgi:hypothetical protein